LRVTVKLPVFMGHSVYSAMTSVSEQLFTVSMLWHCRYHSMQLCTIWCQHDVIWLVQRHTTI